MFFFPLLMILSYKILRWPKSLSGFFMLWKNLTKHFGQQPLVREDTLEKKLATHSSIPVWEIPWTEGPGKQQSTGSQKVGQDLVAKRACNTSTALSLSLLSELGPNETSPMRLFLITRYKTPVL